MPQCPQCNKPLVELTRQCPSCRADLDLLVDYVNGLQGSLSRAEQLVRVGDLGQAVWAYLEVLEVDPDNAAARQQVGQIATAVRQFDRTAPGRRWAQGLPPSVNGTGRKFKLVPLVKRMVIGLAVLVAFGLGYLAGVGMPINNSQPPDETKKDEPKPELSIWKKDNLLGPGPK